MILHYLHLIMLWLQLVMMVMLDYGIMDQKDNSIPEVFLLKLNLHQFNGYLFLKKVQVEW